MSKIFKAIALIFGLIPAVAAAQVPNFSQSLPANSVVGRLGIGPGPAQAIPFATLVQQLLAGSTMTINGTSCAFAVSCTVGSAPLATNQVLGNISGGVAGAVGLTQTQLTALLNPFTTSTQGAVPASGGGTATFLRADGTFATPSGTSCAVGYFCVSNFANAAAAFSAATAAGGGTVYFDQSVTLSAAQTVSNNIKIECSNTGVIISTSSTTADLFTINGANTAVEHCGFGYAGSGAKTSGYHLNITSTFTNLTDLKFDGGCFICIRSAGINHNFSNIVMNANAAAVSGTSGGILSSSEILHLVNITIGSGGTFPYQFALKVPQGAVDAANLEFLQTNYAVWLAPTTGVAAFIKVTTSYFDNCLSICALLQTAAGTIGYAEFSNTEFGTTGTTGQCLTIDTSFSGNVGSVKVSNSELFNYNAGGNCVNLVGSLGEVMLSNNIIGNSSATGVAVFNTCGCSFIGNSIHGTTNSFSFISNLNTSLITANRLNGRPASLAGTTSPNYTGNLP